MKKRILIAGLGLLLIGGGAVFFANHYADAPVSIVVTEQDEIEAGNRVREGGRTTTAVAAPLNLRQSVRLAIGNLGLTNEEENQQVGTFVTTELSRAPGLILVERQELNRVLREMHMGLSGLVRAADAVRVGKQLKVDWFLLGSTIRLAQTNFVVARVVDVKTGLLLNVTLVGGIDRPLLIARTLADFARRVRETAAQPKLQEFLAIGQFADVGVNGRQASFAANLKAYLMSAYQGSNITLLEREYVDALLQEVRLDLAGLTAAVATNEARPFQCAFWMVEGFFQSQESSGLEVEVNLRINRIFGKGTRQDFRGKPDENLFRQIKSAIDMTVSQPTRDVRPTRLSESRLQMFAGVDLYQLATGGRSMEVITPGMRPSGYSPQETSMRRRNLEEAIRAFQTVLLLEPEKLEAKYNLAICCHEESLDRIEEARNYFRELASSTNYTWSQKAMLSLGKSFTWEDSQESAKWYKLALTHAQNPSDAGYAEQFVSRDRAEAIERNARAGAVPDAKDLAIIIEQLEERVRGAENVLNGKSGGIGADYGVEQFARAFGKNRKAAAEQIAILFPKLRSQSPALVPHLLGSAVTYLADTNSPIYTEFLKSLESVRARPDQLVGPKYYFEYLFVTTYDWCLDQKLYLLAADLIAIKRHACERIPELKMDAKDGVRLGFAYLKSQDYTNALKAFEELGETPVVMMHDGVWGQAFTPVLPASIAADCRAKLGLANPTDNRRFELGKPCLDLGEKAPFVVEPDGLWLGIGHQLHHLTVDLQTILAVSLPGSPSSRATALCLDGERVWIATDTDGLFEYNNTTSKCQRYTMKDGLLMDGILSLHLADECLWIGYGRQDEGGNWGESGGGLGRLDLRSRRFSSFTPTLTSDLISSSSSTSGRTVDPADRPPRNAVLLIENGPSRQIILQVVHADARSYFPDKDQWVPLRFKGRGSVASFAANLEHLVAGISVAHDEFELWDVSTLGQTNLATTTRKRFTEEEYSRLRADPVQFKRIKSINMVWQPALAIYDSSDGPPRIVADDGSLPEYPQHLLLAGSDVVVGGNAYIAVYDLKQMRVRKLARIPTRTLDSMQIGAGFLWVQFEGHLYRTPLAAIQ